MAIVRWNPFLPATYREWFPVSLSWSDLLEFPTLRAFQAWPRMDVYKEGEDLAIKIEVPDYKADEVDVHVDGSCLTISGKHEHEEKTEEKDYYRRERYEGSFTRSMRLPEGISEEYISANLKDGVLEVRVKGAAAEKVEEGKVKIPIETA